MTLDKQIEFLQSACEDLQGTIRAFDVKAEVLLVAMTVPLMNANGIMATVDALTHCQNGFPRYCSVGLTIAIAILWLTSLFFILRVLKSSHNPVAAVRNVVGVKGAYYAAKLYKFSTWQTIVDKVVTSELTFVEHVQSLPVEDDAIRDELAFEQMKLGYISVRKLKMFNFALQSAFLTTIVGTALWLLHLAF